MTPTHRWSSSASATEHFASNQEFLHVPVLSLADSWLPILDASSRMDNEPEKFKCKIYTWWYSGYRSLGRLLSAVEAPRYACATGRPLALSRRMASAALRPDPITSTGSGFSPAAIKHRQYLENWRKNARWKDTKNHDQVGGRIDWQGSQSLYCSNNM